MNNIIDTLIIGKKYLLFNKYELVWMGKFKNMRDVPETKVKGFYLLEDTMELGIRYPISDTLIQVQKDLRDFTINSINKYKLHKKKILNKCGDKYDIFETDNMLKIKLKEYINNNNISLNDYKDKFKNDNHFNNMKRLLKENQPLSWEKFIEFAEILDIDVELILK